MVANDMPKPRTLLWLTLRAVFELGGPAKAVDVRAAIAQWEPDDR